MNSLLSEKTISILRKVQKHILEEPKRVNMSDWGAFYDPEEYTQKAPCGAVGCIAGEVCILQGLIKPEVRGNYTFYLFDRETELKAQKELELTREQAKTLFYLKSWNQGRFGWPIDWCDKLDKTIVGTEEYAQVVSDRIDYFIETGE